MDEFHSESVFMKPICSEVQLSQPRYPANTIRYLVLYCKVHNTFQTNNSRNTDTKIKKTFLILQYSTLKSTVVPATSLLLLRLPSDFLLEITMLHYCTPCSAFVHLIVHSCLQQINACDTLHQTHELTCDWTGEHMSTCLKRYTVKIGMWGASCT